MEEYTDLGDVVNIAAKVKEVEQRLTTAQAKVKLFNSRERYSYIQWCIPYASNP